MARSKAADKTAYFCGECGGESPKWQGQCPHCGAWNTLTEAPATSANAGSHRFSGVAKPASLTRLAQVSARETPRISTGVSEFDRALGGGLIAGQVALIGGDPGIGKSTLLLQCLAVLARRIT